MSTCTESCGATFGTTTHYEALNSRRSISPSKSFRTLPTAVVTGLIDSPAAGRHPQLVGSTVRLEDGRRSQDDIGRRLAYLYTADGLSIDVRMISEWLAEAWARDGQHRDTPVGLQQPVRGSRTGCLCG